MKNISEKFVPFILFSDPESEEQGVGKGEVFSSRIGDRIGPVRKERERRENVGKGGGRDGWRK